jgi:hypothetical protein
VDQSDSYMDEAGSGFGKFYTLRARGHNGKLSDCSLPVFGVAAPVDSQVYELARTSHINLSYDAVNQLVDIDWDPVPGAESYQVLKLVSAPAHPAPEGPYLLMENETSVSSIDLSPQWGKMNCYRIVPENRISKLSFSDLWSNESWEHACIIVP